VTEEDGRALCHQNGESDQQEHRRQDDESRCGTEGVDAAFYELCAVLPPRHFDLIE
jgi:hypothetical protein